MDLKAFHKLSYGLYIICSSAGDVDGGCVVNTFLQVTSNPARVCVAVNKENFTCSLIEKSGFYTSSVITEEVDMNLIRQFGFSSSKDTDKFTGFDFKRDENHIQYPVDGISAVFSMKVIDKVDAGTHMIFFADVLDSQVLSDKPVMTYAYYHTVKNGKTPPKASSYQESSESKGWRCSICGYVHEDDNIDDDFICPVCKQPRRVFEKISG